MKYVYLILSLESGSLKIGISKNPKKRIMQLQTGSSGSELKLLKEYRSKYYLEIEKALHSRFSHIKKHGEWFEYDLDLVEYFDTYCINYEKNIEIIKKNVLI